MKPGDHVLTFGKHKGKTIDNVAETDEGLLYLDYLRGLHNLREPDKTPLKLYLGDATIQAELRKLL